MTTNIHISRANLFNWQECLWYLDRGFDDCIYQLQVTSIMRAFDIEGEKVLVEISYTGDSLKLLWLGGAPSTSVINYVHKFVADWFDLEKDLSGFYLLLLANKSLAYMANDFNGLRFIGMPDLFESMAWGIMGQQINLTFAYKLKRQLVEKYGSYLLYEGTRYWIFPSPAQLSVIEPTELRKLQFSQKKTEYLIAVAQLFAAGTINKDVLGALPDFASRQKLLTDIRGIGIWTANYVLMKSMKESSSIPYGDAGILNALLAHSFISNKKDIEGIHRFYGQFSGWESYLTFYLWRSLAVKR